MKGSDGRAATVLTAGSVWACEICGRTGGRGGFGLTIGSVSTEENRIHWCSISGNAMPAVTAIAAATAIPIIDHPRGFLGAADTLGADAAGRGDACTGTSC